MSDLHDEKDLLDQRAKMVGYAMRFLGDRERSEDIVQEAYARFKQAIVDQQMDEPQGYLRRIVRNLAIDFLRRRKLEQRFVTVVEDTAAIPESTPDPEQTLAARQDLAIVLKTIEDLPEPERIAITMHRFEGRRLTEIAEHLGVSVAHAHKLIYRGLERCRLRLLNRE